ncbi:MAG TPA: biotin carboxylase N-terminal domain-containing protein [Xanthobacteraceae bacterium]|nr:biotin carboxylase N-terminal domain-containing protein [Xanthobacteraceae bacterium]
MFSSVLIANRGEIAVRIARTARRMGLRTIAVYSDADAGALHARVCDEAIAIGPAPAAESYLAIDKLIAAAQRAKADCIHPGYGFLAENAAFASACAAAGIVFVGPPPAAIGAMGLKDRAKALMQKAGVPVVPGYHGERQDIEFLKRKAYETGYPVLIKAVAGGGGKGMRRVDKHSEFEAALAGAVREAAAAFGDPRVLIEKYVASPRHIEIQVFADRHGNVIHLNERDCSLQRRHQKVIEEAPAPGMTAELRAVMGAAAVEAARAVGYEGAGTVEFIADGARGLRADGFWFMEMNTRLQVEHPVTEETTGFDLVEWQFRVASGERLPIAQAQVPLDGHAVEARLYAEDPDRGFLPSTGKLLAIELPSGAGIRVDAGLAAGDAMTRFYDPLIAKMIAHAPTRVAALDRLAAALERTLVAGIRTNVGLLAALARADGFRSGQFDTGFVERLLAERSATPGLDRAAVAAGAAHLLAGDAAPPIDPDVSDWASPWDAQDGFQLSGPREITLPLDVDGSALTAAIAYRGGAAAVTVDGIAPASDARVIDGEGAAYVLRHGRQTIVRRRAIDPFDAAHAGEGGRVTAPMHGKVIEILVAAGDAVRKGQKVAVIEAMKMEHALTAAKDGTVNEVRASAGDQVAEGAVVLTIDSST